MVRSSALKPAHKEVDMQSNKKWHLDTFSTILSRRLADHKRVGKLQYIRAKDLGRAAFLRRQKTPPKNCGTGLTQAFPKRSVLTAFGPALRAALSHPSPGYVAPTQGRYGGSTTSIDCLCGGTGFASSTLPPHSAANRCSRSTASSRPVPAPTTRSSLGTYFAPSKLDASS